MYMFFYKKERDRVCSAYYQKMSANRRTVTVEPS